MVRVGLIALLIALGTGCETLQQVDRTLDAAVPTHPVTGAPLLNVVSEQQEVQQAQQFWVQLAAEAQREGIPIDAPGPRTTQIQQVFGRLVAVAHRPDLPWQVHLVQHPMVNAFTPGGGLVVVMDGLFGGLVADRDDDALAAVLAHEIAHVTMLHTSQSKTWATVGSLFTDRGDDPYYRAAFSTEQEAEADRMSLLYLALAGFDPLAPARVWKAAHDRSGSDPRASQYLYDHPLNAERMRLTLEAVEQVLPYWMPGQQNPNFAAILDDNALFPRRAEVGSGPGSGFLKALEVGAGAAMTHRATKKAADAREEAAALATAVRVVAVAPDVARGAYAVDVQNASPNAVSAVQLQIVYLGAGRPLAQDPSCSGAVAIPPGQVARVFCRAFAVTGADQVDIEVARFQ